MANKVIKIPLTDKGFALINESDLIKVSKYSWRLSSHGYAITRVVIDGKFRQVSMHRVIADTPEGLVTDHINGDKLDNRSENLRACSHAENTAYKKPKTTKPKGVYWNKTRKNWLASIRVNGVLIYLGRFKDQVDAIKAYNEAALQHFGEFAWLNKLETN